MVIEVVCLLIKNLFFLKKILFFKHAFVQISKCIQIRENDLMNCMYTSSNFSSFQHRAELISSDPGPQLTSTHFVSFCFLEYFKVNSRHHIISPETNKLLNTSSTY